MLASFALIVGIDNILDYNTNYDFVQHVLSMSEMQAFFSDSPRMMHRAIHNVGAQKFFYAMIITGEITTGLLFFAGGIGLLASLFGKIKIGCAKSLMILGLITALSVWYLGFGVVGSEYFAMWANKFNGQITAYTFSLFILLSNIYILSKEYNYDNQN
jgi:predicted small integral membrane protein